MCGVSIAQKIKKNIVHPQEKQQKQFSNKLAGKPSHVIIALPHLPSIDTILLFTTYTKPDQLLPYWHHTSTPQVYHYTSNLQENS
jgi:hypothetical protein